jgi:hypothetical protein
MGLAFLTSVVKVCGPSEGRRPPQQVINHRLGLFLNLGESFVHVTALEMRAKSRDGDVDGRARRGDLNLNRGFPFDPASSYNRQHAGSVRCHRRNRQTIMMLSVGGDDLRVS